MTITNNKKTKTRECDILICLKCAGSLLEKVDCLICDSCGLTIPTYVGIPDFRRVNPEFHPSDFESKNIDILLSAFFKSSFEELTEIRFGKSATPSKMDLFQRNFELSHEQKGESRAFHIKKMLKDSGRNLSGKNLFLDIGCGTGTATTFFVKEFGNCVAIDYSLADLIIGQKYVQEREIPNIKFVCADAKHLPLKDDIFDFVNASDVIEHIVPGQDKFMLEVKRILKKGGVFYFNSPNRFNLFGPEPHVQVWFVGFFPRFWMHPYVKGLTGLNYRNYNLLSLKELKSLIYATFGVNFFLQGPFIDLQAPATDFKRKVIKKFPLLLTIINFLLFFFTTGFEVITFKKFENE